MTANKRALVTGASQGIGAAIAEGLAAAGCDLVLSAVRPGPLQEFATQLAATHSVQVTAVAADLGSLVDVHRLVETALGQYGGLDILVNNAGVSFPESVVELTDEAWDTTIAVNLRAPSVLAAQIGAAMGAAGAGRIVNVASTAGLTALKDHYAYCVSKAGMIMATKMLALELGPLGVRANVVCPTVVLTEMGQRVWGDADKAAPMLERIPTGHFAVPEDVVSAVLYFALWATDMINGVSMPIDGGYSIA